MSLPAITSMGFGFAVALPKLLLRAVTTRGYGPAKGNLVFMGFVSR